MIGSFPAESANEFNIQLLSLRYISPISRQFMFLHHLTKMPEQIADTQQPIRRWVDHIRVLFSNYPGLTKISMDEPLLVENTRLGIISVLTKQQNYQLLLDEDQECITVHLQQLHLCYQFLSHYVLSDKNKKANSETFFNLMHDKPLAINAAASMLSQLENMLKSVQIDTHGLMNYTTVLSKERLTKIATALHGAVSNISDFLSWYRIHIAPELHHLPTEMTMQQLCDEELDAFRRRFTTSIEQIVSTSGRLLSDEPEIDYANRLSSRLSSDRSHANGVSLLHGGTSSRPSSTSSWRFLGFGSSKGKDGTQSAPTTVARKSK